MLSRIQKRRIAQTPDIFEPLALILLLPRHGVGQRRRDVVEGDVVAVIRNVRSTDIVQSARPDIRRAFIDTGLHGSCTTSAGTREARNHLESACPTLAPETRRRVTQRRRTWGKELGWCLVQCLLPSVNYSGHIISV